jgi:RNA polymerase sigma factor (sigma-70 family)
MPEIRPTARERPNEDLVSVTANNRKPGSSKQVIAPTDKPGQTPDGLVPVSAEWTCFYDDQYHLVIRFLMHNGATQPDAEDATHEAFTESYDLATRSPGQWRAITGKAGWIRTVALRKYRRPPGPRKRPLTAGDEVPDLPALTPGPEDLTIQAQLVLQALQILDEEARAVIAFDIDGIPSADVARELRITQQRVRDIRKKARAALKRQLDENAAREGGKRV